MPFIGGHRSVAARKTVAGGPAVTGELPDLAPEPTGAGTSGVAANGTPEENLPESASEGHGR